MENRNEWKGPYFDRIDKKEYKKAGKLAEKCGAIIGKIQQHIGKELGSTTFSYNGHVIHCSLGKQGDYYHGRFLVIIETRDDIHWRKITTLHDNKKDFPFTQYEEELHYDKPKITQEIDEDNPFYVERRLEELSIEIGQWEPAITSPQT